MSKQRGGRRANQTGRPKKVNKKIRVGVLFLEPDDIARLARLAQDGESLIRAARRILVHSLDSN